MNLTEKHRERIYSAVYYLLVSLTFCYIYYQKIGVKADFYSPESSTGIFAVLDFEAMKVMQYRLLIPFIYKALSLVLPVSVRAEYFIFMVMQCFILLYVFYRLLNEYFENRDINALIAPVIIYPMAWNLVILNGQSFYVDFSNLIFILLGYYFIIKKMNAALILTMLIGSLNHDSIGFLIPMYVLFNYKRIFTRKVILTVIMLSAVTLGIKAVLSQVFINNTGVSFRWNHIRNYNLIYELSVTHILRDILLVFGGLHLIVLAGIKNPVWKKISGDRIMINMTLVPYIIIIFLIHSTEEMRNYIAAIPFVIIPFLILFSSLDNGLLKLKEQKDP